MGDRTSLTVYPGMTGMAENAFINVKNRSYTITAPVELKDANTNGVIIAQAGAFGGWVLYMKDGRVHHEYNYFGVERTNIGGQTALPRGNHEIKYEFIVDAPKPGSGGKCALYVDGQKVAEGRIPKTQPYAFSADEGTDIGVDNETMVSNDYKPGENKFSGKIEKVTIDTKPSNVSAADAKAVEDAEDVAAIIED
jgi:arylsulfatase